MVAKIADKIGLNREIAFGLILSLLETAIFKELNISTWEYQNILLICCCRDNSHHLLKYLFRISLSSMVISLSNVSNLLQNGHLLFSAYFGGHFCYFYFFASVGGGGGQISLLMHVALTAIKVGVQRGKTKHFT